MGSAGPIVPPSRPPGNRAKSDHFLTLLCTSLGISSEFAKLLLMDTEMKLALSGVNLKEPVRVTLALAPPDGLEPPTGRLTQPTISLIEDSLQLSPLLHFSSTRIFKKERCGLLGAVYVTKAGLTTCKDSEVTERSPCVTASYGAGCPTLLVS
jgi:hypothetical protein